MSGQYPGWYKKGLVVTYKGKKEKIIDCYFTGTGCHNDDNFNVVFESGNAVNTNTDETFYEENNDFRPLSYLVIDANLLNQQYEYYRNLRHLDDSEFGKLKILELILKNSHPISKHIDKTWEAAIKYTHTKTIDTEEDSKFKSFISLYLPETRDIIESRTALNDFKLKKGY